MQRPKIFCFWKTEVKRLLVAGILLSILSVISGLGATQVFATSATLEITLASGDLEFTVLPGVFNSGSKAVTVTTNNFTGYTMALSAAGSTTNLVHTVNSAAIIPTLTLPTGSTSITSSQFSGTEYGYSLNGTDFKPVVNGLDVKTGNSGTENFNFTVGAITETNTLAGDYEQTITLSLVANAPAVSVTYDDDTTDTVTDMPDDDEFTMSNNQIVISSDVPVRIGYDFLGWEYVTDTTLGTTAVVQPSGTIDADPTAANVLSLTALWYRHCDGICYDGNGDDQTGTMGTETISSSATTVMLWAPNFSKPGYGFAGWNTEADGSGTTYGPNETIDRPDYDKLWLYAMWVAAEQNVTMQTFNKDLAPYTAYTTGKVIALEDERDGNVYAIAKLADGNWWMIENLRLNPADSNTTITAANTNNPDSNFLTDIATNYKGNTAATLWQTCQDSNSACLDQISFGVGNIDRSNTANPNGGGQNVQWYAYGVVYNWFTATAGHGIASLTNTTVPGDICPAGWHLPTGTGSGEVGTLSNLLGGRQENGVAMEMTQNTTPTGAEMSDVFRATPNNFVYSGQYNATSTSGQNVNGSYWLSTVEGTAAYGSKAIITNFITRPGTNSSASYFGYPVRCIASVLPATYTLNYDAGDGTGAPASQTESSNVITISLTEPTLTGYDFMGWATTAGAYDAEYQPGDQITVANAVTTLYAVWEKTCPGICYDNNGGTGYVDPQSANPNSSILLWTTKFSRAGYGFAGWNTRPDGSGTNYGTNETITMPASGKLWLYANWVAPEQNVTLQTFDQTAEPYASAAQDTVIALRDERDNNVYTVAKLADGNWWMTENLRLNLANSGTTITAINTNNPTADFVTAANTHPVSSTNWCTTTDAACLNQVLHNATNVTGADSAARYQYASYYNWYTATAGQGTYEFDSGIAPGDICPAGWHLPTGGTNGEFRNLNNVVNNGRTNTSASLRVSPYNFVYGGLITGTTIESRGSFGRYWSSTAANNNDAIMFGIANSSVIPANPTSNYSKFRGFGVRCIANPVRTFTLTYDANGGTGAPAAVTGSSNNIYTYTLSSSTPTREGASFVGWAYDSGASEQDFEPGDTFTTTNPNITLYAVWDRECEGICYDGNGATAGTMDEQTVTAGANVFLETPNFVRSGFGFAGWNTRADGAGTMYGPNEAITVPASGTLWLYATWVAASGNLQNFSCSSLSAGDITGLTDTRDGSTYAIAKLADDKCWMIENLRLDLSKSNVTITAANTNNPTAAFITDAGNHPTSSTSWCTTSDATCNNQILFNTDNLTGADSNARNGYGTYYNWYTATAGQGTFEKISGDTEGDICPAGWHLPTGTGAGEFGHLTNALGGYHDANNVAQSMDGTTTPTGAAISGALRNEYNNFVYNGYYSSAINYRGNNGYYWTSTANNGNYAYRLGFNNANVTPGTDGFFKYGGFAVRCVANYYDITFDAGDGNIDGESVKEVIIDHGQALGNTIPEPKRFNYIFTGWVDSNNDPIDENTVPAGDTTYTATWRATTFPTIWHQDGSCFFGGTNGTITGADCADYAGQKFINTGVQLYNSTNHDQDYEIGFTIRHFVPGEQDAGGQETIMNTKNEGTGYPGLVFRRSGNRLEIASRRTSGANSTTYFDATEGTLFKDIKIRIVRRMKSNNVQSIYYSVNDGQLVELNNLGSYNPTFDLPVWFGATPTNASATTAQRFITGEISDMYIRLGTYEEY